MIKPLRKKHFYTWIVLAVLVPTGFVSAYLVIPQQVFIEGKISPIDSPAPFSNVVFKVNKEEFLLNVREEHGNRQIEVVVTKPLTTASTNLYLSNEESPNEIEQAILLGAIGTKGVYRFNIETKNQNEFLLFYDGINGEIYQTIKLN